MDIFRNQGYNQKVWTAWYVEKEVSVYARLAFLEQRKLLSCDSLAVSRTGFSTDTFLTFWPQCCTELSYHLHYLPLHLTIRNIIFFCSCQNPSCYTTALVPCSLLMPNSSVARYTGCK